MGHVKKWNQASYSAIEKNYLFAKGIHENFFDDGFSVAASRSLGKTTLTFGFLMQQSILFSRLAMDGPFVCKKQPQRCFRVKRFRLKETRCRME